MKWFATLSKKDWHLCPFVFVFPTSPRHLEDGFLLQLKRTVSHQPDVHVLRVTADLVTVLAFVVVSIVQMPGMGMRLCSAEVFFERKYSLKQLLFSAGSQISVVALVIRLQLNVRWNQKLLRFVILIPIFWWWRWEICYFADGRYDRTNRSSGISCSAR